MIPAVQQFDQVRTSSRRGVGVVLAHHPTLPAWIVDFPEDTKFALAWFDDYLTVVAS